MGHITGSQPQATRFEIKSHLCIKALCRVHCVGFKYTVCPHTLLRTAIVRHEQTKEENLLYKAIHSKIFGKPKQLGLFYRLVFAIRKCGDGFIKKFPHHFSSRAFYAFSDLFYSLFLFLSGVNIEAITFIGLFVALHLFRYNDNMRFIFQSVFEITYAPVLQPRALQHN